jgi:hypothetical protein
MCTRTAREMIPGVLLIVFTSAMLDFYFCDTGFYRQLICTQDSGHESDWEFATVIWKSVGNNQYQQDSMVFEQMAVGQGSLGAN